MTDATPEFDPAALALAVAQLRAAGEDEAADALMEAAQPPPVAKAMSALTLSDGGALVPDGAAVRRKRKRKAKRWVDKVLKSLGG